MERDLFAWADLAMDIVQGVALTTILWQLFYLRLSHIKENHRRAAEKGHKARARPPGRRVAPRAPFSVAGGRLWAGRQGQRPDGQTSKRTCGVQSGVRRNYCREPARDTEHVAGPAWS